MDAFGLREVLLLLLGAAAGAAVAARVQRRDEDPVSDDETDSEGEDSDGSDDSGELSDDDEPMKLLLLVRKDLRMGKGKIGAQCGHATLGAYRTAMRRPETARWVKSWQLQGQKKICLAVESESRLHELAAALAALGVPTRTIRDAGHTQVDPGTVTVCGVGPAPASLVDKVTASLKLLN